jgi:hypothetical protein
MPGRHWIVCYNSAVDEYRFMEFLAWLSFKYCAKEDIQPDWDQKGIYESKEDAEQAYTVYLTK